MTQTLTAFVRLAMIIAAGLLLTSIAGAAVIAAPITVPLLILIAMKSHDAGWRVAATTIATLTILETTWMLTWALWKTPAGSLGLALAAAIAFAYALWHSTRPPNSTRASHPCPLQQPRSLRSPRLRRAAPRSAMSQGRILRTLSRDR